MPSSDLIDKLVREYYRTKHYDNGEKLSIYEIWEKGGALNDSVTPSTFSRDYRAHVLSQILEVTHENDIIFSIGCGNGFIEGDLVSNNRTVRAIDCIEKAVELSRAKGVDAYLENFYNLEKSEFDCISLIYADGLIGHLYEEDSQLFTFFHKLGNLRLRSGTYLFLSNDSPSNQGDQYAPHDKVPGFWFISKEYLSECLVEYGFEVLDSYYYRYSRPISGLRNRTICLAKKV